MSTYPTAEIITEDCLGPLVIRRWPEAERCVEICTLDKESKEYWGKFSIVLNLDEAEEFRDVLDRIIEMTRDFK